MTNTCSTCRFHHTLPWQSADIRTGDIAKGEDHFCRYDPPEFVPPATGALKPTHPDGWCGRYEKAIIKRTKTS